MLLRFFLLISFILISLLNGKTQVISISKFAKKKMDTHLISIGASNDPENESFRVYYDDTLLFSDTIQAIAYPQDGRVQLRVLVQNGNELVFSQGDSSLIIHRQIDGVCDLWDGTQWNPTKLCCLRSLQVTPKGEHSRLPEAVMSFPWWEMRQGDSLELDGSTYTMPYAPINYQTVFPSPTLLVDDQLIEWQMNKE